MSKTEEKVKKTTPTPYEKAVKVAEEKLPKLYARMEPGETVYTGPEVARAIGLEPTDVNVRAVALTWHKMYDDGKVAQPQFVKPEAPAALRKRELPRV
jgi:hypothetical protein